MAEHTTLPWKLEVDQHFGPGFVITSANGGMHNRCPVVRMSSPLGEDDETLRGDAELIVRAVNSHASNEAKILTLQIALTDLIDDLNDLMHDSFGVAGLHNNGDHAPWSELTAGGRFEDWLSSYDRAILALAATAEPTGVGASQNDNSGSAQS